MIIIYFYRSSSNRSWILCALDHKQEKMEKGDGFPASPQVVQYYTLRKAGSRQKQRSWNSHEEMWWQWLWWQRGRGETVVLSLIRWKVRMTDRCNPLSDKCFFLFSLSAWLSLLLLPSSAFISLSCSHCQHHPHCVDIPPPTAQWWTLPSPSLPLSNSSPPFSGDLSSIRKNVWLWTENGAVGGWGTT